MSNKQKTSVDQLFDQLSSENLLGLFTHDQMMRAMEILDEAKAMHKEEIIKAMSIAFIDGAKIGGITYESPYDKSAEQYYNETYRGNNGNNNSN
jgi:hypothetical protein